MPKTYFFTARDTPIRYEKILKRGITVDADHILCVSTDPETSFFGAMDCGTASDEGLVVSAAWRKKEDDREKHHCMATVITIYAFRSDEFKTGRIEAEDIVGALTLMYPQVEPLTLIEGLAEAATEDEEQDAEPDGPETQEDRDYFKLVDAWSDKYTPRFNKEMSPLIRQAITEWAEMPIFSKVILPRPDWLKQAHAERESIDNSLDNEPEGPEV